MNIKRIGMYFIAVAMTASMMPSVSAATQNPTYSQQYVEDFESNNKDTVLGEGGILSLKSGDQSSKVSIKENAKTKNHYLSIESDTDNTNGCRDVQVNMKTGLLTNDVTVIDMKVSATNVSNKNFPAIMILDGSTKIGNGNSAFWFNNSGVPVLADITPGATATSSTKLGYYSDETWYDLKIVLDRTNKTVTTSMCGTTVSQTSTMTSAWSDDITLRFQSALGETFNIDDIVISDGFYQTDYYFNNDFEQIKAESISKADIYKYIPGLSATSDITPVYDTAGVNAYIQLPKMDATTTPQIYTNNTCLEIGQGRTTVVEFDMNTCATSNVSSYIRVDSSKKPELFKIEGGKIIRDGKDPIDVSDGFHSYRATIYKSNDNIYISELVDGEWIGNLKYASTYAGAACRLDILNLDTTAGLGLDNIKIYYPAAADLKFALADRTDVGMNETIKLVANTPINSSSRSQITLTENGNVVECSVSSVSGNSVTITPTNGLQPNTTYTLTTNTFKDMFDQAYNKTYTFKTASWKPVEAEFTYTIDGAAAESGKFSAGTMNAKSTVKSNMVSGATVYTYVVQYEGDRISNVSVLEASAVGLGSAEDIKDVTIPETTTTIKIMTWDGGLNIIDTVQTLVKK